jgi:hypothetical protein
MGKKPKLSIGLLVLRCNDIEVTRAFYDQLGFVFSLEKHGSGPEHFACERDGFVLELYPSSDRHPPDKVRFGLALTLSADSSGDILQYPNLKVLRTPDVVGNRLVMLLEDPDGRKVEISQALKH